VRIGSTNPAESDRPSSPEIDWDRLAKALLAGDLSGLTKAQRKVLFVLRCRSDVPGPLERPRQQTMSVGPAGASQPTSMQRRLRYLNPAARLLNHVQIVNR
jgi:hypothetical protein